VLLDFPKDVLQVETAAPHPQPYELRLPGLLRPMRGDVPEADELAELIARAERPLILSGHGVQIAGATELLRQVAERAQIPVAHTLLGIGNIDETHPLSAGYAGMHGWMHANKAIQQCDLLIGIGCRYDDRITGKTSTFAPNATLVHVDVDRSEIGKNVRTDLGIVADAGDLLAALLRRLPDSAPRDAWMAQLAEWRAVSETRSWHGSGAWREGRLSADYVVDQIGEATAHAATLVSDVGQNQMWAARYFGFREPFRHLSSGGLGTMGYAVPAAMGAALGTPERETWAIVGDGGFQMTMQELATLVQDQIPVRIAVLNNHRLGMIRQWQEIIYDENYHSAELLGPDLVRLCEAYGIPAWRATKPEDVPRVIAEARKAPGPALIDFHLDEAQNVYPMMLPGKGLSDMVEGTGE
jgi:acetolactate synthase-1/2/3 large subunit